MTSVAENPIVASVYRGHGYAVTCERAGGPDSRWVFWVDVFTDINQQQRALPTKHDNGHSFASKDDAQKAGARLAEQLIDGLIGNAAR